MISRGKSIETIETRALLSTLGIVVMINMLKINIPVNADAATAAQTDRTPAPTTPAKAQSVISFGLMP